MKKFKQAFGNRLSLLVTLAFGLMIFLSVGVFVDNSDVITSSFASVFGVSSLGFLRKNSHDLLCFKDDPGAGGGGAKLDPESEKALLENVKSQVLDILKDHKGNPEEIKALKEAIEKAGKQSDIDAMKEQMEKLGLDLKAMKEPTATPEKPQSLYQQIVKSLEGQKEKLSVLKDRKGESVRVATKSATTMTTGNVTAVGTNGLSMILNDFEPGLTPIPRQSPFFVDLLNTAPTTGNTVSYAEMKNPDGGAGMTGEGSAKTQADFDIVEAKSNVKKITSFIKVSKEALDDIPQLAAEINGELRTLVMLKLDSQAMTGDGTGNNLNGVITSATAFSAGSFAATIAEANEFDVLAVAANQVRTAEVISGTPAGFMPNYIVINPTDFTKLKLTKGTDGHYLFPVTLPGMNEVINVPVISNPYMTVGDFLIGDFTKANLRVREGLMFDIGYENDDFTKNLVTILGEMRVALYVKSNHTKAFVTGTFADAIADLLAT